VLFRSGYIDLAVNLVDHHRYAFLPEAAPTTSGGLRFVSWAGRPRATMFSTTVRSIKIPAR